jgi:hypothetical protein
MSPTANPETDGRTRLQKNQSRSQRKSFWWCDSSSVSDGSASDIARCLPSLAFALVDQRLSFQLRSWFHTSDRPYRRPGGPLAFDGDETAHVLNASNSESCTDNSCRNQAYSRTNLCRPPGDRFAVCPGSRDGDAAAFWQTHGDRFGVAPGDAREVAKRGRGRTRSRSPPPQRGRRLCSSQGTCRRRVGSFVRAA